MYGTKQSIFPRLHFGNESFKRQKGFKKLALINKSDRKYWAKNTHVDYAVNDHSIFTHKQNKSLPFFFFPRISSRSKRKKSIKVLNYNVLVWCVVINKLNLKKCCTKNKKAQCPRYWRSTIGKTEYFIAGRKRIAMTIVSSILKLRDHSSLWIFIIPFLLLLWGNLSWTQNTH